MNKVSATVIVLLIAVILAQFLLLEDGSDPFAEAVQGRAATIPIATLFEVIELQNDAVRQLWTAEIVGNGKEIGLSFDEDWRKGDVQSGPLPALFLRDTSTSLQLNPVPLGLFLGSDFPINDANKFSGIQAEKFEIIKETQEPQFFYADDTQLYTAMFSDIAVAEPCVSCHNQHEQTQKSDWILHDVMGATTWSYPKAEVSMTEALDILAALENAFRDAYKGYLFKLETFENPPTVGEQWPVDGYYVPSADEFMAQAKQHYASKTLDIILSSKYGQSKK